MKKQYQNRLFGPINFFQKDLIDKKIDEDQFNFLVGVLLKNELNKIIRHEIEILLPNEGDKQKMTFFTYTRNRKFDYASR